MKCNFVSAYIDAKGAQIVSTTPGIDVDAAMKLAAILVADTTITLRNFGVQIIQAAAAPVAAVPVAKAPAPTALTSKKK